MHHERAAYVITVLYCRFPRQMYINYMRWTALLAEWLIDEDTTSQKWQDEWPNIPGADICSNCRNVFGTTIGARLRYGCPKCCSTDTAFGDPYSIAKLADLLQVSYHLCEYLLCHALLSDVVFQEKHGITPSSTKTEPQQHSITEAVSEKISAN